MFHSLKFQFSVPRISFSVGVFEVFENQTSANILLTRSGDLNDAGSFGIKTVALSSANAAIRKYLFIL